MNLLVVGHVLHTSFENQFFAYGPYVREMNRWFQFVDRVTVLSPLDSSKLPDPIDLPYEHSNLELIQVPEFNLIGLASKLDTMLKLPGMIHKTWKAMNQADHIHLRCPGNMGLLGAMVQIFFPEKIKSAKYAGNWDRKSLQPFSYRLQQKIITSPRLARNMKVLVYGEWPNESKNIFPFFTASYSQGEVRNIAPRILNLKKPIRLVFVGGLSSGKQPLITAKVALELIKKGIDVQLDFLGEGEERTTLEAFIYANDLSNQITLHGNVSAEKVKTTLQEAHFLIFLSESEGWPKAVAEAMFWACLPITTNVSCVPQMLGMGKRGDLVKSNVKEVVDRVVYYLGQPQVYQEKVIAAAAWSQSFTLEKFEKEIRSIILER